MTRTTIIDASPRFPGVGRRADKKATLLQALVPVFAKVVVIVSLKILTPHELEFPLSKARF